MSKSFSYNIILDNQMITCAWIHYSWTFMTFQKSCQQSSQPLPHTITVHGAIILAILNANATTISKFNKFKLNKFIDYNQPQPTVHPNGSSGMPTCIWTVQMQSQIVHHAYRNLQLHKTTRPLAVSSTCSTGKGNSMPQHMCCFHHFNIPQVMCSASACTR